MVRFVTVVANTKLGVNNPTPKMSQQWGFSRKDRKSGNIPDVQRVRVDIKSGAGHLQKEGMRQNREMLGHQMGTFSKKFWRW